MSLLHVPKQELSFDSDKMLDRDLGEHRSMLYMLSDTMLTLESNKECCLVS